MNIWYQLPFVRMLIPLIAGILLALNVNIDAGISPYYLIPVIVTGCAWLVFKNRLNRYSNRWIAGIFIFILFFTTGFLLCINQKNRNSETVLYQKDSYDGFCTGIITEPVSERASSVKAVVKLVSMKDSTGWKEADGKAIIYFEKDSASLQLCYGDHLLFESRLQKIPSPQNPGEFDYRRYLANNGIFHRSYQKSGTWEIVERGRGNILLLWASNARENILNVLKANGLTGNEYAVAAALLVGCSDKLDPDLMKEYAGAGAMHILCVSGLHVGIIYIILFRALFFLRRRRYQLILKTLLVICCIWFYALITGMSPSVMRASTMFSFIAIGKLLNRHSNIYNTIAASAFLLLVTNPFILTGIGFQLSYLAVIAILRFQPGIYRLWVPRNRLVDKIWEILAVSFAAQLGTFPLSVFYFHQFPNLFLLTNLIVVPLVGVLIYTGVFLVIFSSVPLLSWLLAKLLILQLRFMNFSVGFIEELPYSTMREINVNAPETIILYAFVILLAYFFISRRSVFFKIALTCLLVFAVSGAIKAFDYSLQKNIIVYCIRQHTAIDFIDGNRSILLSDSMLLQDKGKVDYHLLGHRTNRAINKVTYHNFENLTDTILNAYTQNFAGYGKHFEFYGKRLVIVDEKPLPSKKVLKVDYLLISGNPRCEIADILKAYKPELVVIDASSYLSNVDKWSEECRLAKIKCYNALESGAFIVDLK